MKAQKKPSTEEIERHLVEDAENPDAWEPPIKVARSRSPRPPWYRQTAEADRRETIRMQKGKKRTALIVDIEEARRKRQLPVRKEIDLSVQEEEAIRRKRLHDAIAGLPEGQRRCIQLWLDGFKYDDISRALAITVDAVKSRLREAKSHLRSRMEGSEHEEAGLGAGSARH